MSCSSNKKPVPLIVIANGGLNLRVEPVTTSKIIYTIPKYSIVHPISEIKINSNNEEWIKISYLNFKGWVSYLYLKNAFEFLNGKRFSYLPTMKSHLTILFLENGFKEIYAVYGEIQGYSENTTFYHYRQGTYSLKSNQLILIATNEKIVHLSMKNKLLKKSMTNIKISSKYTLSESMLKPYIHTEKGLVPTLIREFKKNGKQFRFEFLFLKKSKNWLIRDLKSISKYF